MTKRTLVTIGIIATIVLATVIGNITGRNSQTDQFGHKVQALESELLRERESAREQAREFKRLEQGYALAQAEQAELVDNTRAELDALRSATPSANKNITNSENERVILTASELAQLHELCLNTYHMSELTDYYDLGHFANYAEIVTVSDNMYTNCEKLGLMP